MILLALDATIGPISFVLNVPATGNTIKCAQSVRKNLRKETRWKARVKKTIGLRTKKESIPTRKPVRLILQQEVNTFVAYKQKNH
jgi:hypothetical protein